MNILVIGSKGFIGRRLSQHFREKGYLLRECDVEVDYTNKDYYQVDASNSDYREVLSVTNYDVCINCSGAASVPHSFSHNFRDFTLNVANVYKLLHTIKEVQPKCKFVNLSSAAVYGSPQTSPISEDIQTAPISPYGIHKMQSEEVCREFYKHFSVKTISLRIFSAYGKGLKKQFFWDLYQKAISSNEIELFGTGQESRDYIHIDDLVRVIELVINHADFRGQALNVANGEEVKIKDVCDIFLNILKWKGKVLFIGNIREGDPLNWKADITDLKKLGYKKGTTMEEGLTRYKEWIGSLK